MVSNDNNKEKNSSNGEMILIKNKISEDKREKMMKRRTDTLFKKANELSVLCDTEVSMILLTRNDHQLHQHTSSGNMNGVLQKVELCLNGVNPANLREQQILQQEAVAVNGEPEKVEDQIPLKNRYLFDDEDFRFISLRDARNVEQELSKGLRFIEDKKEKILNNSLLPPQKHDNKDCRFNEIEETQQHCAPMKKPIYYNFLPLLRSPSAEDAIAPSLAENRDSHNEDSFNKVDEIQLPRAPEKKHEYCDTSLSLRLPSPVESSSRNEDGIASFIAAEKHDNKGWFKNVEENEQHRASVKHESSLTPDCCILSLKLPSPVVSLPPNEDKIIPFVAEKRDKTDCFKNVEEIQQIMQQ